MGMNFYLLFLFGVSGAPSSDCIVLTVRAGTPKKDLGRGAVRTAQQLDPFLGLGKRIAIRKRLEESVERYRWPRPMGRIFPSCRDLLLLFL